MTRNIVLFVEGDLARLRPELKPRVPGWHPHPRRVEMVQDNTIQSGVIVSDHPQLVTLEDGRTYSGEKLELVKSRGE